MGPVNTATSSRQTCSLYKEVLELYYYYNKIVYDCFITWVLTGAAQEHGGVDASCHIWRG